MCCRFLDSNAYVYGFLIPAVLLVIIIFSNLVRCAIVARYVISMQVDKRIREKMRRKKSLQVALFSKVSGSAK